MANSSVTLLLHSAVSTDLSGRTANHERWGKTAGLSRRLMTSKATNRPMALAATPSLNRTEFVFCTFKDITHVSLRDLYRSRVKSSSGYRQLDLRAVHLCVLVVIGNSRLLSIPIIIFVNGIAENKTAIAQGQLMADLCM